MARSSLSRYMTFSAAIALLAYAVGLSFAGDQRQPVQLRARAPELRDVDEWINTKPLTLAKLRGQVVVLHFWTFG